MTDILHAPKFDEASPSALSELKQIKMRTGDSRDMFHGTLLDKLNAETSRELKHQVKKLQWLIEEDPGEVLQNAIDGMQSVEDRVLDCRTSLSFIQSASHKHEFDGQSEAIQVMAAAGQWLGRAQFIIGMARGMELQDQRSLY
jgi:hypothetical protein